MSERTRGSAIRGSVSADAGSIPPARTGRSTGSTTKTARCSRITIRLRVSYRVFRKTCIVLYQGLLPPGDRRQPVPDLAVWSLSESRRSRSPSRPAPATISRDASECLICGHSDASNVLRWRSSLRALGCSSRRRRVLLWRKHFEKMRSPLIPEGHARLGHRPVESYPLGSAESNQSTRRTMGRDRVPFCVLVSVLELTEGCSSTDPCRVR